MNPAIRMAALLSPPFTPAKLFKTGDLGAFYDPSDMALLYQDAAGTTAVTAIGQVFGQILDKQSGAVMGAELWVDASATLSGEASRVSPGVYRLYSSAGALTAVNLPGVSATKTYAVSFTVDSVAVAGAGLAVDATASMTFTGTGAKSCIVVTGGTSIIIKRGGSSACDYQISNVSVREIPGYHARQTTAGSRPTLNAGGKINYSAGAKSLVTTWASSLGTSCTVGRSVPQGEATILTGQTITTTYTDTTDHCALVIINRALSATETNQLRRWLNRRAG
jgi:hypothetical protein